MIVASEFPTYILIVDDKENVREALCDRVQQSSSSYHVATAADAAEALARLASREFDVVLCDLVLGTRKLRGNLTGLELVREIHRRHRAVRIVVFTGKTVDQTENEVLRAGAFLFLSKPLNFDALAHTIKTINSIRRTEHLERSFRILSEIAYRLQSSLESAEIATRVVAGCCELGFDRSRLYEFVPTKETLVGKASCGMPRGFNIKRLSIPFSASPIVAEIFKSDRPGVWDKKIVTERWGLEATEEWMTTLELDDIPWIDAPLMVGDKRMGTLSVDNRHHPERRYLQEDLLIMGVLSGLVAQALKNAELFKQQAELYKQEALANASLRRVLLDAPDMVVTTDLHGIINIVSPSSKRVTGYEPDELIGLRASDLYVDALGVAKGAGERIAREVMGALWKEGTLTYRKVHLRGEKGATKSVSLSASLLHDDDGEAIGTLGFLKDLEALEGQSRQYRELLEGIGYGVLLLAGDGSIAFSNLKAASLLGRDLGTLVGSRFVEIIPAAQAGAFERAFRGAVESGEESVIELILTSPDGSPSQARVHVAPVRLEGRPASVVASLYGQQEYFTLLQWGRLAEIGRMVASVAHELNNPLNNLLPTGRDLADLLRRSKRLTPRLEAYLDIIERNGQRIQSIVQQLRDFARPREFHKTLVSLPDVLKDSLEFFAARFRENDVVLDDKVADELPDVMGDSTGLWQVLVNIIGNAAEAMEGQTDPKIIQITGRLAPPWVVIEISDTGPGIPEELLGSLFDPFVTTKAGGGQGTGLGLATSKSIVEDMHGGTIEAANRSEGRGACFTLRLRGHFPA